MIPETEINSLFIDFNDLTEKLYQVADRHAKALLVIIPDYHLDTHQWKMVPDVHMWCRENHIKYRKVTIGNSIFNTKGRVINYIGEKCDGLLFYTPEDATAFKLRWM